MTVRNIKKNLAGAEDLLHGIGIESQSRGGAFYDMHKLDTYVPTYDVTEMQKSSLTFMRLYGDDTHYTDYRRNPAGTVGIPSDLGGVWEPIKTSELQVVGNSLYGAYVYDVDQVMCHNSARYSWSGAFPKVVSAGSLPAESGGVGAGAWVDRTDLTLRSEIVKLRSLILFLSDLVGSDYTASTISNALLSASSVGARVIVDEDYVVNGPITIPSNCDLFFLPTASITHSTGDTDLLSATNKSNIKITSPTLIQSITSLADTYTSCIQLTGCTNVEVTSGIFSGYVNTGIAVDSSSNVIVSKNSFPSHGITSYTNSSDISFFNGSSNCTADLNSCVSGAVVGIRLQLGTTNCRVTRNTIKNCTGYGIISYNNNDSQISESVISQNYIDNITGDVIYDGQTQRYSGAGIYLLNPRNMHVCDNTIKNTNILTEGETLVPGAIGVNGAKGSVVISGNIIEDPRWYGIACFSESSGYEEYGNIEIIGGSVSGKNYALTKSGVYVKNRGNVSVNGVKISSLITSDQSGILVSDASVSGRTVEVINNKISNFSLGVNATNQEGLLVSGNSIKNVATAIRATSCTKVNILGGVLKGHTTCGIDLVDTTYSNVDDVVFDSVNTADDIKTRGTACTGTTITIKQRTGKINNTCVGARVVDYSDVGLVSYSQKGDTQYFRNVTAGGYIGNVCTTAGASGASVIKNFGLIAS